MTWTHSLKRGTAGHNATVVHYSEPQPPFLLLYWTVTLEHLLSFYQNKIMILLLFNNISHEP